ncbi:hypothetical protein GW17_00060705, partial [Ensete ventricosum]
LSQLLTRRPGRKSGYVATCFIPRGAIHVPVPAISSGLASGLKITWPLLSPPIGRVLVSLPCLFSADRNKMTYRYVVVASSPVEMRSRLRNDSLAFLTRRRCRLR